MADTRWFSLVFLSSRSSSKHVLVSLEARAEILQASGKEGIPFSFYAKGFPQAFLSYPPIFLDERGTFTVFRCPPQSPSARWPSPVIPQGQVPQSKNSTKTHRHVYPPNVPFHNRKRGHTPSCLTFLYILWLSLPPCAAYPHCASQDGTSPARGLSASSFHAFQACGRGVGAQPWAEGRGAVTCPLRLAPDIAVFALCIRSLAGHPCASLHVLR